MGVTKYYSANGRIVSQQTNSLPAVDLLDDALGTVTATSISNSAGKANSYRYLPYGRMQSRNGGKVDSLFGWIGRWGYRYNAENSASHYIRQRTYATSAGAWTSIDRLWPKLSAYRYSRPTLLIDPSGMAPCIEPEDCRCSPANHKKNHQTHFHLRLGEYLAFQWKCSDHKTFTRSAHCDWYKTHRSQLEISFKDPNNVLMKICSKLVTKGCNAACIAALMGYLHIPEQIAELACGKLCGLLPMDKICGWLLGKVPCSEKYGNGHVYSYDYICNSLQSRTCPGEPFPPNWFGEKVCAKHRENLRKCEHVDCGNFPDFNFDPF